MHFCIAFKTVLTNTPHTRSFFLNHRRFELRTPWESRMVCHISSNHIQNMYDTCGARITLCVTFRPSTSSSQLRTVRWCLLWRKFWHSSYHPFSFALSLASTGSSATAAILPTFLILPPAAGGGENYRLRLAQPFRTLDFCRTSLAWHQLSDSASKTWKQAFSSLSLIVIPRIAESFRLEKSLFSRFWGS